LIRKDDPDDLAPLLEVWYDASRVAHPFLSTAFMDQERRAIAQTHLPNAETWVYEEKGAVVGFMSLISNEIGGLFVTSRRHRCGIGRAPLDHVRASRDHLEVEVFEANRIGRSFYDAYGFEIVETQRHAETGHKTLRMRLDVNNRRWASRAERLD